MTNQEKFIEVMNATFNARFTKENMLKTCSPCGILKFRNYACDKFSCDGCKKWWDKEFVDKLSDADDSIKEEST